ncbi:alpha/beta hydrolase [Haloferula sp. A504]|uniref:alpha/beta hydrolase n=1 Tax=Haloferula sp. A504 TaxID=3373601 RepID=UPI0031C76A10|nr:alpha/beta hydrolase [Verrucomicrobiaceae bacterium E54]
MKSLLVLLLTASPLLALGGYPPDPADARVETYREVDGVKLRLWIFGESDPAEPKPAIVFFFGGGWKSGSPAQFEPQARHFAERGMIAITADYRVASRHQAKPIDCVSDAKAAIAWTRENAGRLGIDPARIAAAGGSAGGHIAACTGTVSGFGSDERPNAMILFNPACTLAPIAGWDPKGFGTNVPAERLGAEPEAISPSHHIGKHTPPTLILHGKKDTTVPYDSVQAFDELMHKAKRDCKLVGYEGQGHGFFNRGKPYDQTLAKADRFLVGLGWIR